MFVLTSFNKTPYTMKQIETLIKSLLHQRGKTQQDLCKGINLSYTGLRKIYARNSMELSTLRKIADYLGVPMTTLIGEGVGDSSLNNNSLNTINDGEAINRLVGIIEEKDRQISRLIDLIGKQT